MKERNPDIVAASEIAAWAWCPESWRLDALGAEPANRADLERGEGHHSLLAFLETWSRSVISVGRCLLAFAALVALLALVGLFLAGDS